MHATDLDIGGDRLTDFVSSIVLQCSPLLVSHCQKNERLEPVDDTEVPRSTWAVRAVCGVSQKALRYQWPEKPRDIRLPFVKLRPFVCYHDELRWATVNNDTVVSWKKLAVRLCSGLKLLKWACICCREPKELAGGGGKPGMGRAGLNALLRLSSGLFR